MNVENQLNKEQVSDATVDKYLKRIKRKRELKEASRFTSTPVFNVLDVTRLIYLSMPSTTSAIGGKFEFLFDFDVPLEDELDNADITTLTLKEELNKANAGEKVVFTFGMFEYAEFNPDKKAPFYLPNRKTEGEDFLNQMMNPIVEVPEEEMEVELGSMAMGMMGGSHLRGQSNPVINGLVIDGSVDFASMTSDEINKRLQIVKEK